MYTNRDDVPGEVYEKVLASLILASRVCLRIDETLEGPTILGDMIDGHVPHNGVCHLGRVILCEAYDGLSAIGTPLGALTMRHPKLEKGKDGGPFLHMDSPLHETLGLKPMLSDGVDIDNRPRAIYIDNVGAVGPVWDITKVGKAEIEEPNVAHDGGSIVVEACHAGCRRTKNIFSEDLSRQLFAEIVIAWGLDWALEINSHSHF
jgi:hypothetical protein